jgi:hypothetical protein
VLLCNAAQHTFAYWQYNLHARAALTGFLAIYYFYYYILKSFFFFLSFPLRSFFYSLLFFFKAGAALKVVFKRVIKIRTQPAGSKRARNSSSQAGA